jgi:hypothetical protein
MGNAQRAPLGLGTAAFGFEAYLLGDRKHAATTTSRRSEARPQARVAVSLPDMRVNSLLAPKKFPVPMRREFGRNPLIYVCETRARIAFLS